MTDLAIAGEWPLPDGTGECEVVATLIVPRLVVRAGQAHALGPVPLVPAGRPGP